MFYTVFFNDCYEQKAYTLDSYQSYTLTPHCNNFLSNKLHKKYQELLDEYTHFYLQSNKGTTTIISKSIPKATDSKSKTNQKLLKEKKDRLFL